MNISVLGSTGSIGVQTLDIARSRNIKISVLTANSNIERLARQAEEFLPEYAVTADKKRYGELKSALSHTNVKVLAGEEALSEAAGIKTDFTVNALVGIAGLKPSLSAIRAGSTLALANKETLVTAGPLVTELAKANKVEIRPIDSEHSAIYQCLLGNSGSRIEKIILTASGGPFYGFTARQLRDVSVKQALSHPNWKMGDKITIDSATMMNKGLELIEAIHLFGVRPEQVEVVVHRGSIVHSAVEFTDGAVMAQLGCPDMRLPIQFALTAPFRDQCPVKRISLTEISSLTFEKPDEETFRCLKSARRAVEIGGTAPAILNGANEKAVELFLKGKIRFDEIADMAENALGAVKAEPLTEQSVFDADRKARDTIM
jgi:1-deoxy-D-xylulose-5-phosphate reductoisomerase